MSIVLHHSHARFMPGVMGVLLGLLSCVPCATAQTGDLHLIEPPDVWQVPNLPGQTGRVFSLYGCPGNLDEARRLIAAMKDKGLGNGFDPGPATVASNAALYRYFAQINWPVVGYPPYGAGVNGT